MKGGPIIQQESDEYVQYKGRVSTGSAVSFNKVGNLPYKAIVHAVGPRWTYSGNQEREIALLKKAIRTSLSKARDYTSIALPAISSGIYGFPSDVCANALVEAAVEFSKSDPDSNISEINFVILQDNADVFLEAAKKHMKNICAVQDSTAATPVTTPISNQGDDTASRCHRQGSTNPTTSVTPTTHSMKASDRHGSTITDVYENDDFNIATILSSLSLDSKVILHIYGKTEHSVTRAEKRLRAIIDTQFISEDVIDEKIVGLSDFTTRELESLAKKHNVDIDIDRHPSIYTIKLYGCQEDVLLIKDKIHDVICLSHIVPTLKAHQPVFSLRHDLQEKDREIQHLTQQLTAVQSELQQTRQQQVEVTTALQKDLHRQEEQHNESLRQLDLKQQESQQMQTTLQEIKKRQKHLNQQLQVAETQLLQKTQESQQAQYTLQQYEERERKQKDFKQQLQAAEIQLRQELQQLLQAQATLQQQNEEINHQLQKATTALQRSQQDNVLLQQHIQQLQHQSETTSQDKQDDLHWVVRREEIIMTERVLGKGGYGEVKVAMFRGLEVAAKCLHDVILSPYNLRVFTRDMEIAARVRHPNLLQFIGAT